MPRFSWLGGSSSPKEDAKSVRRAQRHRQKVTKAARKAEADFERRDRRRFGE
jgi:hypothetical protein